MSVKSPSSVGVSAVKSPVVSLGERLLVAQRVETLVRIGVERMAAIAGANRDVEIRVRAAALDQRNIGRVVKAPVVRGSGARHVARTQLRNDAASDQRAGRLTVGDVESPEAPAHVAHVHAIRESRRC